MAINWFKRKDKSKSPDARDSRPTALEEEAEQAPSTENRHDVEPPSEVAAVDNAAAEPAPSSGKGLFSRLKRSLAKTRSILATDIDQLFTGKKQIDDDLLEELEELLITSDLGVQTTMTLMEDIHRKTGKIDGPDDLKAALKEQILTLFENAAPALRQVPDRKPHVVMVVGVNGVGKTTTIGKLAARMTATNRTVLVAAADTFRAAAIEQLAAWSEKAGAELVKHKANADPSAVVFDALDAALARGTDVVFVDTAGRLHTKVNLMEELKKIKRTIAKKVPEGPDEILLVLDATTGQNALSQAKLFHEALGVTGLALTKLDGTAKGGIVVSICHTLNVPLQYIGVGETIEDLQPFNPRQFVEALF